MIGTNQAKTTFNDFGLTWTERTALELIIFDVYRANPSEGTRKVIEPWVTANGLHPENLAYASDASRSAVVLEGLRLTSDGRTALELIIATDTRSESQQ